MPNADITEVRANLSSKRAFEFAENATMASQLADKEPIYEKLAGSDRELSDSIAIFWYLGETGIMNKDDADFIVGLLDVLRKSAFATDPKLSDITKLGLQMRKRTREVKMDERR